MGGEHRLVTLDDRIAPRREYSQAVIEAQYHSAQTERPDIGRGKLDRERDTVQLGADVGNDRRVRSLISNSARLSAARSINSWIAG